MPFYGADAFFAELDFERVLSIKGAPGAGKTFMAFELAEYYLQRQYKLFANVKTVWNDTLPDGTENYQQYVEAISQSVLILDEGGRYLREWKYFGDLFAFPRKFDNYVLIPSRKIPHADLAQFLVKPFIAFQKVIGVPLTVWSWRFDDGDEVSKGWFLHTFNPSRFGVYKTTDLSYDPVVLLETFAKAIEARQILEGRDPVSGMARNGSDVEEQTLLQERLSTAARGLVSVSRKSRRKS